MDKFVIRKPSKSIDKQHEQSDNESRESDTLLAGSNVDYEAEVGESPLVETSETDYFEEEFGTGSGNSLHTETTEEPKNKLVKKNMEELFKKAGSRSFTSYCTRMKSRERFVACAKPHGMKVCHYLLRQPKLVQSSVLLKLVLETGKRR